MSPWKRIAILTVAGAVFAIPAAWLLQYQWNHQMVRVYDWSPISFGWAYLIALPFGLSFIPSWRAASRDRQRLDRLAARNRQAGQHASR
jgi:urea transporter